MALKSYFDGGNEADSRQFKILTLASFSGTPSHWKKFEKMWKPVLLKHGAPWVHTTDAITLEREFSRDKGWSKTSVQALMEDCVSVIESCSSSRVGNRSEKLGIRPSTISVVLGDFKKALIEYPDLQTVEYLCATQCLTYCWWYGHYLRANEFQLYFDQGEPFYGHICDRRNNRKSRAAHLSFWDKVIHLGQSDMRQVPALQAADMLAWSINHCFEENKVRYDWQHRLMNIERDKDFFDYQRLLNPVHETLELARSWKLPRRRAMR